MGVFLITGASGSGKTTLAKAIAESTLLPKSKKWFECISHTTRPIRDGEVDGETYYFVTKQKFDEMYGNGEFAEFVEYHGNLYGISKEEIERVQKNHKHVYIIVDFNGYKQIKALIPNAVGIFIYASKEDCMANMINRGDTIASAEVRISTYEEEMLNRHAYDYVIRNVRGRLSATLDILAGIIKQY